VKRDTENHTSTLSPIEPSSSQTTTTSTTTTATTAAASSSSIQRPTTTYRPYSWHHPSSSPEHQKGRKTPPHHHPQQHHHHRPYPYDQRLSLSPPPTPPTTQGSYSTSSSNPGVDDPTSDNPTISSAQVLAEKRRRNAGASARFRERRKLRERELQETCKMLDRRVFALESALKQLDPHHSLLVVTTTSPPQPPSSTFSLSPEPEDATLKDRVRQLEHMMTLFQQEKQSTRRDSLEDEVMKKQKQKKRKNRIVITKFCFVLFFVCVHRTVLDCPIPPPLYIYLSIL
jgi:hypothetical protein